MKLVKKILMTFIWIILILLVTFNVYNFVSINLLHKELPKIFGYSVLEVVSGSMEPTIKIGDLIIIDTDCEEYRKGDIITFRDVNGSFVTHRIMEIEVDEMITKGDANDSLDDPMSTATIVGKYVTRVPQLGSIMSSLKNPLVMALILAIGIIICFLVSTDKDMKPKLTDEEKEFLEFKKMKEQEEKKKQEVEKPVKEEIVNQVDVLEESREIVVDVVDEPSVDVSTDKKVTSVSVKKNVSSSKNRTNNKKKYYNSNRTNNNYRSQNNRNNGNNNNRNNNTNHKTQGNNKNVNKNNYNQQRKKSNATTNNNNKKYVSNKVSKKTNTQQKNKVNSSRSSNNK